MNLRAATFGAFELLAELFLLAGLIWQSGRVYLFGDIQSPWRNLFVWIALTAAFYLPVAIIQIGRLRSFSKKNALSVRLCFITGFSLFLCLVFVGRLTGEILYARGTVPKEISERAPSAEMQPLLLNEELDRMVSVRNDNILLSIALGLLYFRSYTNLRRGLN